MSDVFEYDEKEKEIPSLARESLRKLIDRKFTLCVPPRKSDDDAIITRLINGFEKLESKLKAQQELIAEMKNTLLKAGLFSDYVLKWYRFESDKELIDRAESVKELVEALAKLEEK